MAYFTPGSPLDLEEQEAYIAAQNKELLEINAANAKATGSHKGLTPLLERWRLRFRRFLRLHYPDMIGALDGIDTQKCPSVAPFIEVILEHLRDEIRQVRNRLPIEAPLGRSEWDELRKLKRKMDPDGHFLGESGPTLRLFKRIQELSLDSKGPILLLGPTGSGKTHVAQLIHRSRLPEDRELKKFHRESASVSASNDFGFVLHRLLGHGKNCTLQGASKDARHGKLQTHAGGTLFVDEIAVATPLLQTLLFDILDQLPLESPFGEAEPFPAEIALIFATNLEPELAVRQGVLKPDLMARIGKRVARISPLRRRGLDIFAVVEKHCPEILERSSSERLPARERVRRARFLVTLLKHDWPDNTRGLIIVLDGANTRRSVTGGALTYQHLEIGNRRIVEEVRKMTDDEVLRFLLETGGALLEEVGFGEQKGRDTGLSQLLGWPESTLRKVREGVGAKAEEAS